MKPGLSLKGRALQLLAQREQSRVELRRKLMSHLRSTLDDAAADAALWHTGQAGEQAVERAAQQVDDVLAWLEANQFASDQRFAESRVHARSARFGNLRIRGELAQHGVEIDAEQARCLKESEFERAWQVWLRKFGSVAAGPSADASAHMRQSRFLAGRGFTPEVIRRVLREARRAREGVN